MLSTETYCRPVGLEDAARQRAAQRDRPRERSDAVPDLEVAGEHVSDDPPRPGVEDYREIDEALRDRDVGDVRHPELVGAVHRVAPCHEREDRSELCSATIWVICARRSV